MPYPVKHTTVERIASLSPGKKKKECTLSAGPQNDIIIIIII